MSDAPSATAQPRAIVTKLPPIAFAYAYPQASPCGGIVAYKEDGDALSIITTYRADHMGGGRSLAAGGFWEVGSMLSKPPETVQDGDAELYREGHEELSDEIKTLISYDDFHKRTEHIWDGMVRKGQMPPRGTVTEAKPIPKRNAALYDNIYEDLGDDLRAVLTPEQFAGLADLVWNRMVYKDGIGVNAVVQKAIRLSDAEFDAILAMPNTEEQVGKKVETFLTRHYNSAADAEADIRTRLADFKYPEEVNAVVRWYNKKNEKREEDHQLEMLIPRI